MILVIAYLHLWPNVYHLFHYLRFVIIVNPVLILDYGIGNSNSIKHALRSLGFNAIYSSKSEDIQNADHIILPGVGHCRTAMESISNNNILDSLHHAVFYDKKPILGICLGMQLMTQSSEEGSTKALGWIEANTTRISPTDKEKYKVPHVGWNVISAQPDSVLLRGISSVDDPFYFCHSYAINSAIGPSVISTVQYCHAYVSLFEMDNIFGVQFHPEKSQECGLQLLRNFLSVHH